jgi:lipoyl(octanoyl) transferase
MNKMVKLIDWELIDYKKAWDQQEVLFKELVDTKLLEREFAPTDKTVLKNTLIFCEHPNVYTLGKSGDVANLLLDEQGLKEANAVFYPIFDLEQFFTDIHRYLRTLEEAIINTLAEYGIVAGRYEGYTGVWLDADNDKARKICAMGVRCSRWVTMHGLAFNVNSDLNYFKNIIPCGIDDKDVTSMERELGRKVDMDEVKAKLKIHLAELFEFEYQ